MTSAVGTAVETGDANVTAAGVAMTSALGQVTASGDAADATANPTGVQMLASVGDAAADGGAVRSAGGGLLYQSKWPPLPKRGRAYPVGIAAQAKVGAVRADGTYGIRHGVAVPVIGGMAARVGEADVTGGKNLADETMLLLLLLLEAA